jgi:hypothetical protein
MPRKGGDGAWQRTDSWNRVNGEWVHKPGNWEQASSRTLARHKQYMTNLQQFDQQYMTNFQNPQTTKTVFPYFKPFSPFRKKRGFMSTVKHRVRKALGMSSRKSPFFKLSS